MPANTCAARRKQGFTLVELLVVIGIIALLISILLPTLSKARESANKTVCLSALRQMGQVLQLYANDFKGKVPIGYAQSKHAGYMVWQNNSFQVAGILYDAGYMSGPKAFFCPSQLDTRWQYSNKDNPWPPPPPNPASDLVRLGLTARPSTNFVGAVPASSTNDALENRGAFPNYGSFRNKAVYAEMFGEPHNSAAAVDPRITNHKNSINILFSDGSAGPVDIMRVDPADGQSIYSLLTTLYNLGATLPTAAQQNQIYLNETVNPPTGIWYKFDQTRY